MNKPEDTPPPRTCLLCEQFYLSPEGADWSERTPEPSFEMGCYRGIWGLNVCEDTDESFRTKMLIAGACSLYQPRSVPK